MIVTTLVRILVLACLCQGFLCASSAVLPDLLKRAQNPDTQFRPVPLWWWDGDRLDIERFRWQLDELHQKGVDQVCVIYLSPLWSRPPYFTEDWWSLYEEMVAYADSLGMKVWLTDGIAWGSPFINDSVLEVDPAFRGQLLERQEKNVTGPSLVRHEIPQGYELTAILGAFAYPLRDGTIDLEGTRDLTHLMRGRKLEWDAPEGHWKLMIFYTSPMGFQGNTRQGNGRGYGIDYTNPAAMQTLIDLTAGEYERRVGKYMDRTVAGTFQDELVTHHHYGFPPFSPSYRSEFQKRKGYDILPRLGALYHDAGVPTDAVRCDYFDVLVQLYEAAFYRPYFEWHESRHLKVGHDQFGRRDLIAQTWGYGDYFRTQRWFQAPGYDDWSEAVPGRNWKDAKLAASIAQLYGRPRVWVEALHSSGWGLDLREQVAAMHENYIYGANIYDMHGLDYSTSGSWYTWAPPSAHFRMPYWMHYREFSDYVTRLSFLQSQGDHLADVAVFYPVQTIQANLTADRQANDMAALTESYFWSTGRDLLNHQIDFHFLDDDSIQRGIAEDGKLRIGGVSFSTVILPPLTTIDRRTLSRLKDFVHSGGLLVSLARLPGGSPQHGRQDPAVERDMESLFGSSQLSAPSQKQHPGGGAAVFLARGTSEVASVIEENRGTEFKADSDSLMYQHRRADGLEYYMLYNRSSEKTTAGISLRGAGFPARFDPRTDEARPVAVYSRDGQAVKLKLTFDPWEASYIYFQPQPEWPALESSNLDEIDSISLLDDSTIQVTGWHGSSAQAEVRAHGQTAVQPVPATEPIPLDGLWTMQPEPTMDNRWGDFRLPAGEEPIGPEVRRFRYQLEEEPGAGLERGWNEADFDDSSWQETTYSTGPYWWVLGPIPNKGSESVTLHNYGPERDMDPDATYTILGGQYEWRPYSFSLQTGLEKDPDYWNRMGPKNQVDSTFLELGSVDNYGLCYLFTHVYSPTSTHALLLAPTSGYWESHQILVNGQVVSDIYHRDRSGQFGSLIGVDLEQGWNTLLIKTNQRHNSVQLFVYLVDQEDILTPGPEERNAGSGPRLRRFEGSRYVFDIYGDDRQRVGWYRFDLPAGTAAFNLTVHGNATVFVDGARTPFDATSGAVRLPHPLERQGVAAIRVVHERGSYAGAAFPSPVSLNVGPGLVELGDWSKQGLESYSGAAVYSTSFDLTPSLASRRLILDLGEVVASAGVQVNGKEAGSKGWGPYRFDISGLVQEGRNTVKVTVASTLANHFSIGTADSHIFEGQTRSGLIGPVRILPQTRVRLQLKQD